MSTTHIFLARHQSTDGDEITSLKGFDGSYAGKPSTPRTLLVTSCLTNKAVKCFVAALSVFTVSGCSEAVAPGTTGLRPPDVVRDMDALNSVSIQFSWEPLRKDTIASYPFAEGVLAAVSIQGLLQITSDESASCVHANASFDYKGVYTFCTGLEQCAWSASISSRGVSVPRGCTSAEPRYTQLPGWSDTILVGGSGGNAYAVAIRGGGSGDPQTCQNGPCHVVSGVQTVAISPLAADLDLRGFFSSQAAQTIFVPPFTHSSGYYQITFADSALPRSAKDLPMPFQAISWDWQKTDPNAAADPYWHSTDINQCPTRIGGPPYTPNICNLFVKESGVILSSTRVNGVIHTDSVSVDCITGDSVLDIGTVRNDIAMRMRAGKNDDPSLRKEKGGVIYKRISDGSYFALPDTAAFSTDCYMRPTVMTTPADAFEVAYYHVHVQPQAPDSASGCLDSNGRPFHHKVQVDASDNGGGSDADWNKTDEGFPTYIMSLHGETFRLDANSGSLTKAQKNANPNRWPWKNNGLCSWTSGRSL